MSDYPLRPSGSKIDAESLLEKFLEYVDSKSLELYPAQEEAILELFEGKNVILNTPTGSGKSLVATAMSFRSVHLGRRSVYTCPIKALVNEKFLSLCRDFGPENVGMMTGDASVNRDAPVLCCTAEILANISLSGGENADVHDVIMDEFHYYSDRDRGFAWQVPLLCLPQARFLLMSATFGDTDFFVNALTELTQTETTLVQSFDRPVPLDFVYKDIPLTETLTELLEEGKAPIYVVHFTQLKTAEAAQNLLGLNPCTREERDKIGEELEHASFNSPYGKELKRALRHGVGVHHAGLLPKYRVLVEKLAQQGLLKIICGTDTLGVGVNVPIRTVVFTSLSKFDGEKMRVLAARDFHQVCGRAGRRGFDDLGSVIAQAPEHEIENLKAERKAASDKSKKKKIVKKAPEKGFVGWSEKTYEKLQAAKPETLKSSFKLSHGMLLQTLSRKTDGCAAMAKLIRDCHETPTRKRELLRSGFELFRALVDREIIEILPERLRDGAKVRVNLDLQEDFSLLHTLAIFLIDTIKTFDPEAPDFAVKTIGLAEAIVENPEIVLRRQLDKLKTQKMAEMKAQGMEFDERMEELEKLEYPKPDAEFIYNAFNEFAASHPWVGSENIHPKSIAREMYERYMSFEDYIKEYGLQRSEGVLLRHLTGVYKVLEQTVPELNKTEALQDAIFYISETVRDADSSLLDEWEEMTDPEAFQEKLKEREAKKERREASKRAREQDITARPAEFEKLIRDRIFRFLRPLATHDFEIAHEQILPEDPDGAPWTPDRLRERLEAYETERERISLEPAARNRVHTHFKKEPTHWRVAQTLVDPEGVNDWSAEFLIGLQAAKEAGDVSLKLISIQPIGSETIS